MSHGLFVPVWTLRARRAEPGFKAAFFIRSTPGGCRGAMPVPRTGDGLDGHVGRAAGSPRKDCGCCQLRHLKPAARGSAIPFMVRSQRSFVHSNDSSLGFEGRTGPIIALKDLLVFIITFRFRDAMNLSGFSYLPSLWYNLWNS